MTDYIVPSIGNLAADYNKKEEDSNEKPYLVLKNGDTALRIMPIPEAWGSYFREEGKNPTPFLILWKHFYQNPNKPGEWVVHACASKMKGQPCPSCDLAAELRQRGYNGDRRAAAMAREMEPKHRFLCNVLERREHGGGKVKMWDGSYPYDVFKGKSLYEKVMALITSTGSSSLR